MSVLSAFDLPANISDLPANLPAGRQLRALWNQNVARWTQAAVLGDPWSQRFDDNRSFYFDPLVTDVPAGAGTVAVKWTAFPGRIIEFYDGRVPEELLLSWADFGGVPGMPTDACPPGNSTPIANTPIGPRGWQDEYCEWSVRRAGGKIQSVMFTCENPEYWFTLWRASPDRVLELYRELVGPAVQMSDLTLKDADGEVIDPATGRPVYNPLNRWNFGTITLPDRGGAVHLTSSPNTLSAEIYLAAAATILREDTSGNPIVAADDLICCARYGRPKRNSDPLIGHTVNRVVDDPRFPRVTLANPVGLYIQEPDWSNWELPSSAPAGTTPEQFWTVRRGTRAPDATGFSHGLHAVYEVPTSMGFTVSDIRIAGVPIGFGSQIAQTFKIGLKAIAIPSGQNSHPRFRCPIDRNPPLPNALFLQDARVYSAYRDVERRANERPHDITAFCYEAPQGSTTDAILVISGGSDVTVAVSEGGVRIEILDAQNRPEGLICKVRVSVDPSATIGVRTLEVIPSGGAAGPGVGGLLTVVPSSPPAAAAVAASNLPHVAAPPSSRTDRR